MAVSLIGTLLPRPLAVDVDAGAEGCKTLLGQDRRPARLPATTISAAEPRSGTSSAVTMAASRREL
jgi:hypothetical protein